ncbi:MAG: di-heme enzyme [Leptospiraceae bacterium]|nr:di-heme enzyme [Leptospiraceae bacterium]MDW8305750.1 di-heme enzyme [Leptospiraceae bacterium]
MDFHSKNLTYVLSFSLCLSTLLACSSAPTELLTIQEEFVWELPPGVPLPRELADNPMSAAKIELGRYLFYDKRLSGDGRFSCASCHHQRRSFADDPHIDDGSMESSHLGTVHAILRPYGITGEEHPRNAMALVNLAWQSTYTWANPLLRKLRTQALIPLLGENPVEMGLLGHESRLLAEIEVDPIYQRLFPKAFPDRKNPFTLDEITLALEAFQRSLISYDAPFDRYQRGDHSALSSSARRGMELFFSEDLECFHCHGGLNFTLMEDHRQLAEPSIDFANTGLYNIGGLGLYPPQNQGLFEFTQKIMDMGKFKAPSLRNVELTAPYMHDGSVANLDEVLDHYSAGGRTISSGPFAGVGSANPFKSGFVKGFTLTPQERADIIAFLKSLTDCRFITNPKYANPWPAGHRNKPDPLDELPESSHPCNP